MPELTEAGARALLADEEGYDPIEDRLRAMVRRTIETHVRGRVARGLGTRSLADEDIVRLDLDGTVMRTRIDKRATNVSVPAVIGVRRAECAGTGRRCRSRPETWAANARRRGPASSGISTPAP